MDSDNNNEFKKQILDLDYNPSRLSHRIHKKWKQRMEKVAADDQTGDQIDFGESIAPKLSREPDVFIPSSEAVDDEEEILDLTAKWISAVPEGPELNDSSSEDELYCNEESSDCEIFEKSDAVQEIENSASVSEEASKKRGRPMSSFVDFNDRIMFPQSGLFLSDVMEMATAFKTAYGLTSQAEIHLNDMLKICAGEEFQYMKLTNYMLNKISEPFSDKIKYYFYCGGCEDELIHSTTKQGIKNQVKVCSNCGQDNIINLSNTKVFLSVDLEYQVKIMLKNAEFCNSIIEKIESATESGCDNFIRDIKDGKLYQEVKKLYPNTIMYILSTDGAPLHHCSKRGFWPLQVILIDLPAKIRYKIVFLVGIMILDHEPKPKLMNLFIKAFNEQAQHLHDNGIAFSSTKNGISKDYHFTLTPLLVTADSVARPILQNRFQYNAYYSCSYCYEHGTHINSIKFPFLEKDSEIRSHESHMSDVKEAIMRKNPVRGVKGWSAFCEMTGINMVWSFVLDAMHNGILGVEVQLWDLWSKILKASQRRQIDDLLLLIKPPRDTHRRCGKISDRSKWKATQWKAWLFYYSIPICTGILSDEIMEHYALFVNAMYTLSKAAISRNEIDKCEADLLKFVAHFELLYGASAMTFNVHLLLHLAENVRRSGPLWAYSAFPFESNIFYLKRSVNGPKSADQQMAKSSLKILAYKQNRSLSLSVVVNEFIENLFNSKKFTASAKTVGNVTFFNECESHEIDLSMKAYTRCIYESQIYSSVRYTRSKLFDDTTIQLKSGELAQIIDICLAADDTCQLIIKKFEVDGFYIGNQVISHIWEIKSIAGSSMKISIQDIASKMVKVDLPIRQFLCEIPNVFEAQ